MEFIGQVGDATNTVGGAPSSARKDCLCCRFVAEDVEDARSGRGGAFAQGCLDVHAKLVLLVELLKRVPCRQDAVSMGTSTNVTRLPRRTRGYDQRRLGERPRHAQS